MSKSLGVKNYKRVIQFQPKIGLFFSYACDSESNKTIGLSKITHAHGTFDNSFVFCTRLDASLNWRMDFVSENGLSSYDTTIILKTVLYILKSQFDLNSEIVLGNQAKFAYGVKYKIHPRQHKLVFKLSSIYGSQKNKLQLKFNFFSKHSCRLSYYLFVLFKRYRIFFLFVLSRKEF